MQADRLQPILDVAVARFEREQALREELRNAHTKLVERKVIERAKGFLMQQKGVSEDEAFRLLRKLAMDRNAKLLEVAQQVVDVAKLLG
jgi:response regulator NasT